MSTINNRQTIFIDNESSLNTSWPDGITVFAKDTKNDWILSNGAFYQLNSGTTRANYSSIPSTASTANATGVMMGYAGYITPRYSGNVFINISGSIFIPGNTPKPTAKIQIRTGTGTAPVVNAALTGTTQGSLVNIKGVTTDLQLPFTINALVSGLTVNTTYWIDMSCASPTSVTINPADINLSAFET